MKFLTLDMNDWPITAKKLFILTVLIKFVKMENSNPIVSTPLGDIKGSILTSVLGKPIYSFRGVRYAKPPIKELRFQPPIPIEKWDDVYDATQDGAACPQPRLLPPSSEDCLFINIYTTKLYDDTENTNRPVLVSIHQGGLYFYSSVSTQLGPQYLLDQDLVLVTFNYRLGNLGLLSTGDELAPGNNAFKDQVLALKWVKNNIASFGGDPDSVTLHGCSTGAVSVWLHLLSPMSTGLFHRAILQSSSAFGTWPIANHQFELAQRQARLVDCPDDTSANIINCLRTKSAKEIADTAPLLKEFGYHPLVMWLPVVELDFGQERFLPDYPTKLAVCGKAAKIPIMIGRTNDEFFYLTHLVNNTSLKELDENFAEIAPICCMYERNTERSRNVGNHLRKFYLGDAPLTDSSMSEIGKWLSDGIIGFPTNQFAKIMAEQSESDPEYQTVKKITTLIANFVQTGNPTPSSTDVLDNVIWDPFTLEDKKYLDINEKLVMSENLYEDRYTAWENVLAPAC